MIKDPYSLTEVGPETSNSIARGSTPNPVECIEYKMKIDITVKLFAYFRDNRFTIKTMQLNKGIMVGEIVDSLDIDREEVGVLMINSRHTEFDYILQQDDVLAIFPVVGGG